MIHQNYVPPTTYYNMFNLAEDWGVIYQAVRGVIKKPLKMSQKTSFWLNFDHFLIAQ